MTIINRPEQIYDVRLVERHVAQGVINRKDYEQYLRQLPDKQDNSEVIAKTALFNLPEEEVAETAAEDKSAD